MPFFSTLARSTAPSQVMIRKHASGGVEIDADSRLAAVRPVPPVLVSRQLSSTWSSRDRLSIKGVAQKGGNRGRSKRRSASAFAYGCPGAFTDWENHLPTARTARTKAPLRRAGVWGASLHRPKF